MRILRVIASMDPLSGGPCQGIRNSIGELEKLDVRNEVVCLDDPAAPFISKDSFPVYALGPYKSPWQYCSQLIPWLLENLPHFDAVIIHGLWLYHGYAVRKAIKQLKRLQRTNKINIPRVYVMPHGMLDPYFQKAEGRKIKAVRNWFYWKIIEGKVIEEADGMLFTCQEELELARKPFRPYNPKQEINIGYGIAEPPSFTSDMREAFLKKCPEIKSQSYFLFLSRIHEKKGVDLLIKAYKKFAELPASNVDIPRLVIAGPGLETAYGQKMFQMVAESPHLTDSVFFTGMLTGDAKWGAFYSCEAFVLPSHQENFGIAVAEALACKKPVLISNQVNIWREIEDGGAGKVAEDTTEGTYELFESWRLSSVEEKQFMKQRGGETFKKFFAAGPAARKLLQAVSI